MIVSHLLFQFMVLSGGSLSWQLRPQGRHTPTLDRTPLHLRATDTHVHIHADRDHVAMPLHLT